MEEKKEGKKINARGISKTIIFAIVVLAIMIVMGIMYYVIKKDIFKTGAEAATQYTKNTSLDPQKGIVIGDTTGIANEAEDGALSGVGDTAGKEDEKTSVVSIEKIFDSIHNADRYLKDDAESTKYEKLQYLMNAELVSKYPYISELEDKDVLNGTIKFYRYTNEIEAEEGEKVLEEEQEQQEAQEEQEGTLNPKKIFYIGDSWTVGLRSYIKNKNKEEYPGDDHFLCESGKFPNGYTSEQLKNAINKVKDQVSSIVIMLGINGADGQQHIEAMTGHIKVLANTFTNKTIYVLKVPHLAKAYNNGNEDGAAYNARLDKYNTKISACCAELINSGKTNVKFIDTVSGILSNDGFLNTEYAKDDGLHLKDNGEGYSIWYNSIKECIRTGSNIATGNYTGTGSSSSELSKYEMKYVSQAKFEEMKSAYTSSGNREIYKYYTIDKDNKIVIAHGKSTVSTIKTNDPEQEIDSEYQQTEPGVYTLVEYEITAEPKDYQSLITPYIMPFNLLWAFLVQTENYKFVKELADIAYNSEVVIAIYDNGTTYEIGDTQAHNLAIKYTENTKLISESIDFSDPKYNYIIDECYGTIIGDRKVHTNDMGPVADEIHGTLEEGYITSLGGESTSVSVRPQLFETTMNTVVNANTTPTIGVVLADTWVGKWKFTYGLDKVSNSLGPNTNQVPDEPFAMVEKEQVLAWGLQEANLVKRRLDMHSNTLKTNAINQIMDSGFTTTPVAINVTIDKIITHLNQGCGYGCREKIKQITGKEFLDMTMGEKRTEALNIFQANGSANTDENTIKRKQIYNDVYRALASAEREAQRQQYRQQLNDAITYEQWPTVYKAKVNIEVTSSTSSVTTTYIKDKLVREEDGEKLKDLFNEFEYYNSRQAMLRNTDWFWEYIQSNEDTVNIEDVIRYVLNIAFDTDQFGNISEKDIEELLKTFDPPVYRPILKITGGTTAEKVWNAFRAAGYSEYAAAGALGNIRCESGFQSNILEYKYQLGQEKSIGYTSESYTEAVDNGTYGGVDTREKFTNDHCGYGLIQWTYYKYKEKLYDFAKSKGVSIGDEDMQIEFLITEYLWKCDAWENAQSPEEAAEVYCNTYERPDIYGENASLDYDEIIGTRQTYAREYYNLFTGGFYTEGKDTYIKGYYTSSSGRRYIEWGQGYGQSSSWGLFTPGLSMKSAGCGVYASATLLSSTGLEYENDVMYNSGGIYETYLQYKASGNCNYTGTMEQLLKKYKIQASVRTVTCTSSTLSSKLIPILLEGRGAMVYVGPSEPGKPVFTGKEHWMVLADIRETTLGSTSGYDVFVLPSGNRGHGWNKIEDVIDVMQKKWKGFYYIEDGLGIQDE